jgi:hypothetical protein
MTYNPKLFIGVGNSQEFIPAKFHWTWEKMLKPYTFKKVRFTHSHCWVRENSMIDQFLESDCDVFLKMDVDQKYPKDYLEAMVPLVEKYKVIGPLIHSKWRRKKYIPLMFNVASGVKTPTPIYDVEGIVEVPYSHTNLFIAREVLAKIEPPWFGCTYNEKGTGQISSSDFEFNDKIKEAGYPIYINMDVQAKHLVLEYIDTEMHNHWNKHREI